MKLAITFLAAMMATTFTANVSAADWVPLGKSGAVDQYFYDRSKLTIKEDQITYWKKVVFATPQSINGQEVASGLLRERIDCAEHTAKLISYLYYATTGETVEYIAKDESDPAPIIPDTVGDAFEQKLCPMVWRKQEEARIKAEQKAAEAELSAIKNAPAVQEKPAVAPVAPAAVPAQPAANTPVPAANPPASIPDNTNPPVPAPSNSQAAPSRQPLPMPQIIEQLY